MHLDDKGFDFREFVKKYELATVFAYENFLEICNRKILQWHLNSGLLLFVTLKELGVHIPSSLYDYLKSIVVKERKKGNVKDLYTLCLFLKFFNTLNYEENLVEKRKIFNTIIDSQNYDGGWGHAKGEISRIPITGYVLSTLFEDELCKENGKIKGSLDRGTTWLTETWFEDLEGERGLPHKGALTILALTQKRRYFQLNETEQNVLRRTATYLVECQLENGGWSYYLPGNSKSLLLSLSSPIYTALITTSLIKSFDLQNCSININQAIYKGVSYLQSTQLPFGCWYAQTIDTLISCSCHSLLAYNAFMHWNSMRGKSEQR